jgi:hypothetical protein
MIRAIAATVLALGFAGTALADRHDDRWDRHDRGRYDRRHDDRRDHRYDSRHDRHHWRHDNRGHYHATPRYDYRWRAPRPRGWYPGWREPYGRGYRYWNDNYYYVVPGAPSLNLSFVVPLR